MNTYTSKERNMYLIGLMGQNFIYNIIATGMTFYFQSVIFIPAMAISVIMGIARVWDAINDPMMGTIVDRTRSKYGKCRPYLFFVPGIVMITTFLTFVNAQYSGDNSPAKNAVIIVWAGVSYILWGMTYTAGDIPIWGITSLMTESAKDREKLLGLARMIAGLGGGIVLLTVMPVSQAVGAKFAETMGQKDGTQMGFIVVCGILTLVGSLLFQCACFAKERVKQPSDAHKGFIDNVKIMWSCKPSCHIRYGEEYALLAGDGLLTRAFGVIAQSSLAKENPAVAVEAVAVLSELAGVEGMIGGQTVDLKNEGRRASLETLEVMDSLKTGALIICAAKLGCLAAGASDAETAAAVTFCSKIGHAFQIVDDILDVIGDEKELGKPIGSDGESDKSTYVSLLGLEKSREYADRLTNEAVKALDIFGKEADLLREIADMLINRKN